MLDITNSTTNGVHNDRTALHLDITSGATTQTHLDANSSLPPAGNIISEEEKEKERKRERKMKKAAKREKKLQRHMAAQAAAAQAINASGNPQTP